MTIRVEVLAEAAWADAVASELVACVAADPTLRIVLPTGDTPSPVYRGLVAAAAPGRLDLSRATVLLLDEYLGLAPNDPARCEVRLRRELLDHLDRGPRFVPIAVDRAAPADAAAAHDRAVVDAGIGLALVGLGRNGHIGLNEPGSGPEAPTRVVELTASSAAAAATYGASRPPSAGITLGMDRLLAADELWLLVTGASKRDVLAAALEGPETPDCPASWLRRHPRLTVLADEAAAGGLRVQRAPNPRLRAII